MKKKANKREKKNKTIEELISKALTFLNEQPIWTWASLSERLNEKDNSLIGNVIHRLKRNGVLRRIPSNSVICLYDISIPHLLKMKAQYL